LEPRTREIHAAEPPVVIVGTTLDVTALSMRSSRPPMATLSIEIRGQRGLRHSIAARQKGQHPPLGSGDTERLEGSVDDDASQTGHVMDQEAEAGGTCVESFVTYAPC